MLRLPRPQRDDKHDLATAIVTTTQHWRRTHLESVRNALEDAYDRYVPAVEGGGSHYPMGVGAAVGSTLEFTYNAMRTRAALIPMRRALIGGEILNYFCPLCGVEKVIVLDHYAPKTHFPEFALLSLNLIPTCSRCNHDKGEDSAVAVEDLPYLHAYVHDLPQQPVLEAHIVVGPESVYAAFSLVSGHLNARLAAKLEHQTGKLGILEKIERAAQDELVAHAESHAELHALGGADSVAGACSATAARQAALWGVNYWRAALFTALATSHGYCDGGFELLRL